MAGFVPSPDGVDPRLVPKRTLAAGGEMPVVGLGTFGSDRYTGSEIATAVGAALADGFRHIDCAAVYGNEREIGSILQTAISGGLSRQELWITSKLWNDKHAEGDVIPACEQTLRDLHLDYLDLYLVHWPFPNFHAKGVDVGSRDPHARPYLHEEFMKTWRQMEKLVRTGLVRRIGTSNMTSPKLNLLLRDAAIKPQVNEMELHPHFQQPALFRFVTDHGIAPVGFCPIGSPARPERDRTRDDTVDIEDPVIVEIAKRHHVHPAVVCVKWGVQRGGIVIPFSVRREKNLANLRSVTEAPLTADEMNAIAAIDRNCRLIKGQVFLWKPGQSWEALWDQDGTVTPP